MTLSNWDYPTKVRAGIGRIKELPEICREAGINNPLLITDSGISGTDMVKHALNHCRDKLGQCGLFDNVKSNPTGENVAQGVAVYHSGHHDGVIALGGGSVLDAGKAVALMSGQQYPLWMFEDIKGNSDCVNVAGIAPFIAIPTTAGTGSEVGRAAVITDSSVPVKRTIFHPAMMPRVAILDGELTVGMSPQLTAATGADALTHCLESWCSPVYHPMSEAVAVKGMQMIKANLLRAFQNGQDLQARQEMLVASALGAVSFQRGLGGVHAIAQSLGALYDGHHGLLNAIVLPYVLVANRPKIDASMDYLARALDLERPGFTGVMAWILELRQSLGIPHTLLDVGIDDQQATLVGEMAFADGCSLTNPVRHSAADYSKIFCQAVKGEL
ncbi:iron-containing alcohol dehydrogenase [Klebsiella aerogenes]|uniref:iron-containing alcohol dehydrogenase n=1 Tax=Klebsiella aerogenes TaxID=548 RepID=UPI0024470495|nr:iron-containing alcohol dehydrogenase [Klebsiella aerogenes]MDH1609358.1 iron-containing alcohol dehydrogenase [Klebsiella aerogenes]MDU9125488.1 iron-containing alcohol dehydrogenase [Klebsiella aerogenes]